MSELFTDWQKDMIAWLCTTHTDAELSNLFKTRFGVQRTASQIFSWRKNHRIKCGRTGYFHTAENPHSYRHPKGTHFCPETEFKKKQVPHNYLPVGSEVINKEGYTLVKICDTGTQWERWKFKHRHIWESSHGKIKKSETVIHVDGNKQNNSLENLRLINKETLLEVNRSGGLKLPADLNNARVSVCEINVKLRNLES